MDVPSIERAATWLHEHLKAQSWFVAVGIGDGRLYVYTTRKTRGTDHVPTAVGGFEVVARVSGKLKALARDAKQA